MESLKCAQAFTNSERRQHAGIHVILLFYPRADRLAPGIQYTVFDPEHADSYRDTSSRGVVAPYKPRLMQNPEGDLI